MYKTNRTEKIETVMTYNDWKILFSRKLKERFLYWLTMFLGSFGTIFLMIYIWIIYGY